MIRNFIKKIPGTRSLNKLILERIIMRNFLACSSLELKQVKFYNQFIKKNDLVFDVGCNVGSRTKLFLNLGGKVVGFEPQEDLCNHLHGHLKRNRRFSLERTALGSKTGSAKINISDAHVLSSMSKRWIEATQKSGRFDQYNWNETQKVAVSTLDEKIKTYGTPQFIKIDVEGYEFEVLKGLTRPINFISIEFTAEDIKNSQKCIKLISNLGEYLFNYSIGESLSFEERSWKTRDQIECLLRKQCQDDTRCWGDIYAKLVGAKESTLII